uniref:Uncharacterized protein n=1 Tax=Pelobates cultripes TaxID=61616 RepID=A0AAD1R4I0_PELCU|nr:Hypothetical predicted protein [Pelobates cultripes]
MLLNQIINTILGRGPARKSYLLAGYAARNPTHNPEPPQACNPTDQRGRNPANATKVCPRLREPDRGKSGRPYLAYKSQHATCLHQGATDSFLPGGTMNGLLRHTCGVG